VAKTAPETLDDLSRFLVKGQAGDYVFREGDASRDMYIVQEGRLELVKQYAGEEKPITQIEVGDFFGEWSLLEEEPREVSARGLTEYRLLRIDQTVFNQIIREDPDIAVRMLRRLSRRLSERQAADVRAAEIAMGAFARAVPRAEAAAAPVTGEPFLFAGDKQFAITEGEVVVGRADPAKSFTPDVDLGDLDTERTLSRRHARVVRSGDRVVVRDEPSARNGTFVNGRRLGANEEHRLEHGDRVRFGLVETLFRLQ
jgi:CRP-like cAMP-binding protein